MIFFFENKNGNIGGKQFLNWTLNWISRRLISIGYCRVMKKKKYRVMFESDSIKYNEIKD